MKLFLDDIRNPKECVSYMHSRIGPENPIYLEEWTIVRNYNEFVEVIKENIGNITHISFDHDLAFEHYDGLMYDDKDSYDQLYDTFKEKTGYDCAKFLKEYYKENNIPLPDKMYVHSMNLVGSLNIINVFK